MIFVFLFLTHFPLCNRSMYFIGTDSYAFLFMAEWYSIVYMYHNCFIHSSVDGHLGCFYVLAIVNSAAMNNGIRVNFSILVSQGISLGVGLQGHLVVLFLVFFFFKGISIPSSIVAISMYIPTNSARAFPFLHTVSSTNHLQTFWWWSFWLVWDDISL